jgi:hypothetical protein
MSPEVWENQFEDLKRLYEHGGKKRKKEEQPSDEHTEEK